MSGLTGAVTRALRRGGVPSLRRVLIASVIGTAAIVAVMGVTDAQSAARLVTFGSVAFILQLGANLLGRARAIEKETHGQRRRQP